MTTFALHGHIIYSETTLKIRIFENSYLVCKNNEVYGIFNKLPEILKGIKIYEFSDKLIVPGFTDLHMHAPQYSFRGLGMDLTLLEWLNRYTFPEEAKYNDMVYANQVYKEFVHDLKMSTTTRALIFATLHVPATIALMKMLQNSGLCCMVGKVSMDCCAPSSYCERSDEYLYALHNWLEQANQFSRVKPILTPRFVISCSDRMLRDIGELQKSTGLALQSHLSENPDEVKLVAKRYPKSISYAHVYDQFNLFGSAGKTVMAHCVYCSQKEIELIKLRGVYIAHCAQSNMNLASGIAPAAMYLRSGLPIGLGSDIGAGSHLSGFRMICDTIAMSKLAWRLNITQHAALSFDEAFYMATKGGGSFFGRVGSFEKGFLFDALVLDDSRLNTNHRFSVRERLEQAVSQDAFVDIKKKFVNGHEIF